jgi:hypothetical protein
MRNRMDKFNTTSKMKEYTGEPVSSDSLQPDNYYICRLNFIQHKNYYCEHKMDTSARPLL